MVLILLGKTTLILLAALGLDGVLHRKWLLPTAAMWNAVLLAIVVLLPATLLVPRWVLPLMPPETSKTNLPVSVAQLNTARTIYDAKLKSRASETADRVVGCREFARPYRHESSVGPHRQRTGDLSRWWMERCTRAAALDLCPGQRNCHNAIDCQSAPVNALRSRALLVANAAWCGRFEYWKSQLNLSESPGANFFATIRPPVRLLQSDRIEVPVALGLFKRAIVIPSRIVANSPLPFVDSILTHELAHVARGDFAWQLLQRMVQALLWFHPLWWISARRIAFIRERACDDFAVHALGDIEPYASTLLNLAEELTRRHKLRLGVAVMRSTNLAHRLNAMQQSAGNTRYRASRPIRWAIACSSLAGTMLLAGLSVGRAVSAEQMRPEVAMATEAQPAGKETEKSDSPAATPVGEQQTETKATPTEPAREDDQIVVSGRVLGPEGAPLAGAKVYAVIRSNESKMPQLKDPKQPLFEVQERTGQAPLLKFVHPKLVELLKKLNIETTIASDDPRLRSPELATASASLMSELYEFDPTRKPPQHNVGNRRPVSLHACEVGTEAVVRRGR